MKEHHKIEAIGFAILLLLWFVGSQMLVGNIAYAIVGKVVYEGFYNDHRYMLSLSSQVLCLAVVLGIDYKYKQFEIKTMTLKFKEILTYIGVGMLVYVACIGINLILMPYFPGYEAIGEMFNQKEPILSFVVIVIMAPILEEYIFRGKIQTLIKKSFNKPIAIIAQALLFGSLHSLALQKVYAAIMGIIFGTIKEKSDKLQCTMIVHMTVNFIGWMIGMSAAL